jgi:hypothetical protein
MARGFDIEASNQGQLNGGAVVGPRSKYNFVEGTNGIALTVADNPGNDSVDVTVDNTGLVSGAADAGPAVGPQPIIRIIAGTNITVGLVEDVPGGELEFTISGSAGAFPGFGAGIPSADSGVGSAGVGTLASRDDHTHPESTAYTNRDGLEVAGGTFNTAASFSLTYGTFGTSASFRPRVVLTKFTQSFAVVGFGMSLGTALAQQKMAILVNAQVVINNATMGNHNGAEVWTTTTMSTTQVTFTHGTGAGTIVGLAVILGDNL